MTSGSTKEGVKNLPRIRKEAREVWGNCLEEKNF